MKTAVVLFNLGGPDRPEAIRPFLFNLFNDPAILRVPGIVRWPMAQLISRVRARTAQEIYGVMGGRSPILENTEAQASALEAELSDLAPVKVLIAMRYWHPMAKETALEVKRFGADRVVLLPLYPQWSTTTTASSVRVWREASQAAKLAAKEYLLCCYPTERGFVDAMVALMGSALDKAEVHGKPRILFSAHGLPKKVVDAGDPYQWQCERTAAAVVEGIGGRDFDWVVCYQSRVGPLEWIGPATDDEIERAGRDGVPVVLVPIAFVSEHSETLVELDEEYRELAQDCGVPYYARVPTVGAQKAYIEGLAGMVRRTVSNGAGIDSDAGCRLCPVGYGGCAMTS